MAAVSPWEAAATRRDTERVSPLSAHERASALLEATVAAAEAEGAVVGLSGGVDSSVTASLAVDALGADAVSGLLLPTGESTVANARDAHALADALGVEHTTVPLQPVLGLFDERVAPRIAPEAHHSRTTTGNLAARLRAAALYAHADAQNAVVVGTANRSERLAGYFTKFGDGAADCHPLGGFYKTEVRELARLLGVPEEIIEKPSTAGFHAGQTDAADLGVPYELLDRAYRAVVDRDADAAAAARSLGTDRERVDELVDRFLRTAHKRVRPPHPSRPERLGDDTADGPESDGPLASDTAAAGRLADRARAFIRETVATAGADGAVVVLDGSTAAATTAALATAALGPDRVRLLALPCHKREALCGVEPGALAEELAADYARVTLRPVVGALRERLPESPDAAATADLAARVRTACAYYAANADDRLVLGTLDRTRLLLGDAPKYGAGAADCLPLGGLYRSEVDALARSLGVPDGVPPAGGDAGDCGLVRADLGVDLARETLDGALARLVDEDLGIDRAAASLGVDRETVAAVARRHVGTRHKRRTPPTPLDRRPGDVGHFHELELRFA